MNLNGKIAVVTGGAMGNGLGIVKVFLKYGAKVIILDYSEKISTVVDDLKNNGYDVSYINNVVDFKLLEQKCKEYKNFK